MTVIIGLILNGSNSVIRYIKMSPIAERFLVRFLALTKPIMSCLETLPRDWFHVELSQEERQT